MLQDLFRNNRVWAAEHIAADPDYFKHLSREQNPDYLWIGCSDSRVPADTITGLSPGDLFVHRNVASLVHRSDLNLMSVLEFAVETLRVKHIIVCGHHGCGGIRAAMDEHRHGIIDHWLQPIRDVADEAREELSALDDPNERLNRLAELNTIAQVDALSRTPIMRSAWKRGNPVAIHGWLYSLEDGLLHDLKHDRQTRDLRQVEARRAR